MQTARDQSICFLIGTAAVLALLLGCSRKAPDATTTFTLATGVKLVAQTACATTAEDPTLSIAKKGSNTYLVRARGSFDCDGELEPFLTVSIDKKATLVLGQQAGAQAASSGCECGRTIDITIENRLESGDTIYVLNDYRVIGHLITP